MSGLIAQNAKGAAHCSRQPARVEGNVSSVLVGIRRDATIKRTATDANGAAKTGPRCRLKSDVH